MALKGRTTLPPTEVLDIIEEAASKTSAHVLDKPGGKLLVARRTADQIQFSMRGPGKLVEQHTFRARVTADAQGRTTVRIGGLDTYLTSGQTLFYVIPIAPKMIAAFRTYAAFLDGARRLLRSRDPKASVSIAEAAR